MWSEFIGLGELSYLLIIPFDMDCANDLVMKCHIESGNRYNIYEFMVSILDELLIFNTIYFVKNYKEKERCSKPIKMESVMNE